MNAFRLPDSTHIGYVHLRVADLARALAFYRDLLGFRESGRENHTVSLSASGQPPAVIKLTELPGARPKPPRTTGLYHVAIRLPDRPALAALLRHLLDSRWPFQGAADHGVSEALYLADPDGNGLELYRDRPRDEWTWSGDQVAMATDPLDVEGLLAAQPGDPWSGIAPGTDIGHVHLQVSDLEQAEAFYHGTLGLDVVQRSYPGALFVSAGGYHHHLGLNTWASRGAPPPPPDAVGLIAFALQVPGEAWLTAINRARYAGAPIKERPGKPAEAVVQDPDQNTMILVQSA